MMPICLSVTDRCYGTYGTIFHYKSHYLSSVFLGVARLVENKPLLEPSKEKIEEYKGFCDESYKQQVRLISVKCISY